MLTERYSTDEQFQERDVNRTPEMPKRVIYDLMSSSSSSDLTKLVLSIRDLYLNRANRFIDTNYAVFLVAPQVTETEFFSSHEFLLLDSDHQDTSSGREDKIVLRQLEKFNFHATFEQLKEHIDYLKCEFESEVLRVNCQNLNPIIRGLNSFSLNLYQIIV